MAALREVADQVNAARSLAEQAQQQAQALETAQAAFDLSQQRYRAGIGNYLDVLSAQQQLLDAQQRLAALQSNQILVSVRLNQALGGRLRRHLRRRRAELFFRTFAFLRSLQ